MVSLDLFCPLHLRKCCNLQTRRQHTLNNENISFIDFREGSSSRYWHQTLLASYIQSVSVECQTLFTIFFLFYEMRSKTKRRDQILIQIYRWIDWFIGVLRHFGRILAISPQFSNWNVLFCLFGFFWRPQTSGTRSFASFGLRSSARGTF
jgi:hypothetical protein